MISTTVYLKLGDTTRWLLHCSFILVDSAFPSVKSSHLEQSMAANMGDGKCKKLILLPLSVLVYSHLIILCLLCEESSIAKPIALRFLQLPKSSDSHIDFLAGNDDTSDTA